ncbi:hypothetical protein D3C71_502050 [compost metagenome]
MKRFLPLLIPIVLLLITIPCLLMAGVVVPAKVLGVFLILLTWVALRIWLRNALRKKLSQDAVKFNVNHRYFLNEISPVYKYMSKGEKKLLEKRMGKLISELQFDDTTREELNVEDMLSYALLQILSVYNEDFKSLKGMMIVFDQTNNTGSLSVSERKYVLLNPDLLKSTLKKSQSLDVFTGEPSLIVGQMKELYREYGK